MISKVFMGEDFLEVKELAKSMFKNVNFFPKQVETNQKKLITTHF